MEIQAVYDSVTNDFFVNEHEMKLRQVQNQALDGVRSTLLAVLNNDISLRRARAELELKWVEYDENDETVKANIVLSVLDQLPLK